MREPTHPAFPDGTPSHLLPQEWPHPRPREAQGARGQGRTCHLHPAAACSVTALRRAVISPLHPPIVEKLRKQRKVPRRIGNPLSTGPSRVLGSFLLRTTQSLLFRVYCSTFNKEGLLPSPLKHTLTPPPLSASASPCVTAETAVRATLEESVRVRGSPWKAPQALKGLLL